jgi:DNA-binding MarR family transcriptional regulator
MARQHLSPDYAHLLRFRSGLRAFLHWSEEQAAQQGLTGPQHQLLLAVKGHFAVEGTAPSIGEVADYLMLRHHSTVELINRTVAKGLVLRTPDAGDRRLVRLALTEKGEAVLAALSHSHEEELRRLAALLPHADIAAEGL